MGQCWTLKGDETGDNGDEDVEDGGVTLKDRMRNKDVRRKTSDIECGVGDRG